MKIFTKLIIVNKLSKCESCDFSFSIGTEMYWSPRTKRVRCKECVEKGKKIIHDLTDNKVDTRLEAIDDGDGAE